MTVARTPTTAHDRALATGLVLAAIGTAIGSLWLITGPGAPDQSHVTDRADQHAPARS